MLEQGVVQELHIERARRGVSSATSASAGSRACCRDAERVRRDRPRARGVPHIADIWEHRQNGHGGATRVRSRRCTRSIAARPGDQGSDRDEGGAPVHAGEPRRKASRLSAAGLAHRHIAAHRRRSRAREPARAAPAAASRRPHRRLHHTHDGGDRVRARDAGRHRVPHEAVGRSQRPRARRAGTGAALPGPEPRATRSARHGDRGDLARARRLARDVHEDDGVREGIYACARRAHRALPGDRRCST